MQNQEPRTAIRSDGSIRVAAPLAHIIAGFALAAYAGVAAGAVAPHVGEDGKTYLLDNSAERSTWLLGKVEPDAQNAAQTGKDVNLVVYVARPAPAGSTGDPVQEIKARHRVQIDELGEQMRTIWRAYKPAHPMTEDQERAHIEAGASVVSRADQARLMDLQNQHDELRTIMHKEVGAVLQEAGLDQRREVSAYIASLGGEVHAEVALNNALAITLPGAALRGVAEHPLVTRVSLDPDTQYELDTSGPSVGYDDWHNSPDGPFVGGAYDFGLVDSGVQEDHPGFSNVDAFYSNFAGTDTNSHGTHVAGIVANDMTTYVYGGPYTGTAPDIDAMIWNASSGTQATTMARMDDLMTDFVQSPEVVNHSLGYNSTGGGPSAPVSTNDYVGNDSFYDQFVRNYDAQVTKSAGNAGWGVDATMTFPANAYNIMVVANMNDRNTLTRTDDVRSGSSSVGPTRNGRRKPDISAPGSSIISTNAFWPGFGDTPTSGCAGNNTDMCSKSGTSMAAPHVAGAIVLQHPGGNLDAQAQKAVLLNTADWWDSNDTSSTVDDGQVFSQNCPGGFDPCETRWDRSYGWGYIDMSEALFNRGDFFIDSVIPRNDTAVEDDYELYRGFMFTNEKATMTWEKRADTYVAGGAAGGQRTLSDLNIRLYSDGTGDLMDSDVVGNDNVHQVAADASGQAVIKVYSWSTTFDGAASETFAIATEEDFLRVNPPSFTSTPLIPIVGPFQTFAAPTIIGNTGGVAAHDVDVTLGNIANVTGDGVTQNAGTILSGADTRVDFNLTTNGIASGTYTIGVSVSSNSYDETYTASAPTGVQFSVETTPPISSCSTLPNYTNDNSIPVPWTATDGFFGTGVDTATLYVVTPGSPAFVSTGITQNGTSGTFNYNFAAGDGTYRFAVSARDIGGNFEGIPAATECSTFRDSVDPDAVASTPATVAAGQIPISFNWSDQTPSSGINSIRLLYYPQPAGPWLNTGLASVAPNGVLNWTPPGPGVYSFVAIGSDLAGNTEDVPAGPNGDSTTAYALLDSDSDGVTDNVDNCTLVANTSQLDTDGDDIGNACDPDIAMPNDCGVDFLDLGELKSAFFATPASVNWNPDADFDGNLIVDFLDLGVTKAFFFGQPGPSAGGCN